MLITKIDSGFAIVFPKKLNPSFCAAFPSAKWEPRQRYWTVGPRSGKRLEQWVQEAKAAADALLALEEIELAGAQLLSLRSQLRAVEHDTQVQLAAAQSAAEMRQELEGLAEQLSSAQTQRQLAQAQAEKARTTVMTARADIDVLLAGVIDNPGLRQAADTMARSMRSSSRAARSAFDEARSLVRAQRDLLRAAGWRCSALSQLAEANFNRPDRDDPQQIPESDWYVLTPVEPDDD